jgi:hypothetical protein
MCQDLPPSPPPGPGALRNCPLLTEGEVRTLAAYGLDDTETLLSVAEVPEARPWLAAALHGTEAALPARLRALAEAAGLAYPSALPPVEHPMGLQEESRHE